MPEPYDLRLFQYVLAIADEGSVSAAARRLNVTQPTVSRQLRDLERRLDTTLFDRGPRGLIPTPAGKALISSASRVLAEADRVVDDVRRAQRGLIGRVTVAFTGSAINGPLGGVLPRVHRDLSNVEVALIETFDDAELTEGLLDNRFDVTVQRLPIYDVRLTSSLWAREQMSVFLPERHPLANRRSVDVDALAEIPLIIWPRENAARAYDEVISICQRAGVVPRVATEALTVQTMLALVASGYGGAVMTHSYSVLRREGVAAVPLTNITTALYLSRRTHDANPVMPRLMEILLPDDGHAGKFSG